MFSDLFQLQQVPVTLFSSTDANAPHLTTAAGSLKTVLKSCLVTGYGTKAALGWDMPFESTDGLSAVFKSNDNTSSQYCLKVDNTTKDTKLSAYKSMTGIGSGSDSWVTNRSYKVQASRWMLIGHGKAFIFITDMACRQTNKKSAHPIVFGDTPRETTRMAHNCVLWTSRDSEYEVSGVQETLFNHPNGVVGYSTGQHICYPFVMAGGENLTSNSCRFNKNSSHAGNPLFDYTMSVMRDGTWTFLPMLLPISAPLSNVSNMSMINNKFLKVNTGTMGNTDCAIPIDFWWA